MFRTKNTKIEKSQNETRTRQAVLRTLARRQAASTSIFAIEASLESFGQGLQYTRFQISQNPVSNFQFRKFSQMLFQNRIVVG